MFHGFSLDASVFLLFYTSKRFWYLCDFSCNFMRILAGFVAVQENIKPEVLKVQTELARSVR